MFFLFEMSHNLNHACDNLMFLHNLSVMCVKLTCTIIDNKHSNFFKKKKNQKLVEVSSPQLVGENKINLY